MTHSTQTSCNLVNKPVTIYMVLIRASGLGSALVERPRDAQCSREDDCPHRFDSKCTARRLADAKLPANNRDS